MNKNIKLLCSGLLLLLFVSCENKSIDFLRKYGEESISVKKHDNRAGVFVEDASYLDKSILIKVNFNNININQSAENLEVLSKRFFVADVRKPEIELPIKTSVASASTTQYAPDGSVKSTENYFVITLLCSEKPKRAIFLMLGFNGIDSTECAELATPPMFFVVSITEKDKPKVMPSPSHVGDFYDATSPTKKIVNEKFIMRTAKLSLNAFDYNIGVYNIDKEEDGNTSIVFFYEKETSSNSDDIFNTVSDKKDANGIIIPLDYDYDYIFNSFQRGNLPFKIEAIVDNKTIKLNSKYSYKEGVFKLIFNTTKVPDKIYIVKDDQKLTFNGKTKTVIK